MWATFWRQFSVRLSYPRRQVYRHDYSFLKKHRAMYAFVCFVFYRLLAIITHLLYLYMRNELEPQSLFASCYGSYIYPGHLLTS